MMRREIVPLHSSPSPDIPGLRRELEERLAGPEARSPLTNRRLVGLGKLVKVAGSFPNGGDAAEQGCRTSLPLGPSPGSETGPEWSESPYFSRDSPFLTCMKIHRIPEFGTTESRSGAVVSLAQEPR